MRARPRWLCCVESTHGAHSRGLRPTVHGTRAAAGPGRSVRPSVARVARAVGVSRVHFTRQFKAVFRRDAARVSDPRAPRAGAAAPGGDRAVSDRRVHGSRLFQPRQLQRAVQATAGTVAVGVPPPPSRGLYRAGRAIGGARPGVPQPDGRTLRVIAGASRSQFPRSLSARPSVGRPSRAGRAGTPPAPPDPPALKGGVVRIKLTSIMVDDQAKALEFYTEVLGFRNSRQGVGACSRIRTAKGSTPPRIAPGVSGPSRRPWPTWRGRAGTARAVIQGPVKAAESSRRPYTDV